MKKSVQMTGFSLMELIIVIVLIGILAVSFSSLIQYSVFGYIDAKDRNRFSQSAKWLTERIAREVREALPQSVRVNSSGNLHCVEIMNIVNASTYLNLPANGSITSFDAVKYDISFSPDLLAAIMPIDTNDLYSNNGVLANIASIVDNGNQVTINLAGPTIFNRRSPQNRFYLLNSPVSFCLNNTNGQLTRYSNYALAASQPTPPTSANSELIAENITVNGTVFNYQPGTLSRAALLQMNFRLQNRGRNLNGNAESFDVFHEVHIRNVP
ncbi:prepilin-type N-terminal cleavage/methylation domain-containing protein [Aliikangiella maris]|uniref:Prepilin-type N-terminal cleavage/methylation domain-containing protein n=2 Tax=Aliikangiella maris TaxID=3162458 RepID=A0ABV3MQI1_9GAMM